jgi:integrase
MRLKWSDVYRDDRCALFKAETQKGKKRDQLIGYSDFAAARLLAIEKPERELVFPWPYDKNADNWQTLRRHLTKYILRPAGLPTDRYSKFHRIRKTTATQLWIHAGEEAAVRQMGHSNANITRKHYIDRKKGAAVRPCDSLPTPVYKRPGSTRQIFLFGEQA